MNKLTKKTSEISQRRGWQMHPVRHVETNTDEVACEKVVKMAASILPPNVVYRKQQFFYLKLRKLFHFVLLRFDKYKGVPSSHIFPACGKFLQKKVQCFSVFI